MMAKNKKLKGAEAFGVKIIVDPSLNKYSNQVLFPEKLARANEVLSKVVNWPPEFRKKKK